jgi:predicted nucleotidyltransferase
MERGTVPPPKAREILERYAQTLGLKAGTDDWYTFFDLAAVDQGMMPADIMRDQELVQTLPAFFRALRGEKPTRQDMMKTADAIRGTRPSGQPAAAPAASAVGALRAKKRELSRRFGIRRIGIFGSTAIGTARPDSDVDVLVDMREPTFDRYMDLKFLLEDLFGRQVDLVLDESLKPALRPDVERDVVYV